MVAIRVDSALAGEDVERGELIIVDRLDGPAVLVIGLRVEVHLREALLETQQELRAALIARDESAKRCDC
jgi:hypothetical protein